MKTKSLVALASFFGVILIVAFFILFSYLIQNNLDFFEGLIIGNFVGIGIYVLLNVIAVVLAPITVLPLIAVATGLWGWFFVGVITAFSWLVGSVIAFLIARKFGVPIVKKFISLEKIYALEEKASIGGGFWGVLLLRTVVPVDILSYALGLFSKIRLFPYTLATAIGILPFTFLLAYLGEAQIIYQIMFGLAFLIFFLIWMILLESFRK
jgi:uncharacterized membrane protein YdjX (TVP38/TMEM64 family)